MNNCCRYTNAFQHLSDLNKIPQIKSESFNRCLICLGTEWHSHVLNTVRSLEFNRVDECNSCHNTVKYYRIDNSYSVELFVYDYCLMFHSFEDFFTIFKEDKSEFKELLKISKFELPNDKDILYKKIKTCLIFG